MTVALFRLVGREKESILVKFEYLFSIHSWNKAYHRRILDQQPTDSNRALLYAQQSGLGSYGCCDATVVSLLYQTLRMREQPESLALWP